MDTFNDESGIIVNESKYTKVYGGDVKIDLKHFYDPNTVLLLHFEEGSGSKAVDSSDYNNHGKLIGNPQWVTGKYGKCLNFDYRF